MARYQNTVTNDDGNPLAGAVVTVSKAGADTNDALPTLTNDFGGALSNPLPATGSDGIFSFNAPTGYYALSITVNGGERDGVLVAVGDVTSIINSADAQAASATAQATAAHADRVLADADALSAIGSKAAALAAASQAALYLAAINTLGIYATETAGRAAVADGATFWVGASGTLGLYRRTNSSTSTLIFSAAPAGGLMVVPSTLGGTGNALTLTPLAGFSVVSGGAGQQFTGVAAATNSAAGPTAAITGVFSGVATQIVLPNGEPVPANTLQTNYPFSVEPVAALGKYVLRHPSGVRPSVLYATQTGGTGNAIVATLNHPGVTMRSDLTGAIINVTVTAGKATGGASLTLNRSDGTTLLGDTVLLMADDATSPATSAWSATNVIEIQRNSSTGRWNLIQRPDLVTPNVMRATLHLIETGYPLSFDRTVAMVKPRPDTWIVDVRPHSSHYRDSYRRTQTDRVRFFVKDMRYYTTLSAPCFVPIGFVARMGGDSVQFSNFNYDEIVGAIIADTGLTPSAFHPVPKLGRYGVDAAADYLLAAPLHGNFTAVTGTVVGTQNDASTSNIDVASADLADASVDTVFSGDRVAFTSAMNLLTPDGHIAARMTLTVTFDSVANYQMLVAATIDFGHAVVNTTPGWRDGSYAPMLPSRDVQAAGGVVSGVAGSTVLLAYGDGSTKYFGNADKLVAWNEAKPKVKAEQVMLFGVPYKQDGVAVPFGDQMFAIDNNYGPKFYAPIGPATPANMAGRVLTFSTGYRAVYADNLV